MSRVVFLLEERSMKEFLDALLPRFFPKLRFLCVPHEGKQDLERSIPRKLRAWKEPGVRFVVLRDNDGANCRALKARLVGCCAARPDTVVRVVCQELEAWYLADPDAVADVYQVEKVRNISSKARFRDPDTVVRPSEALAKFVPAFQKISGARLIGAQIELERSRSASFQTLMESVRRLAQEQT